MHVVFAAKKFANGRFYDESAVFRLAAFLLDFDAFGTDTDNECMIARSATANLVEFFGEHALFVGVTLIFVFRLSEFLFYAFDNTLPGSH